MFRSRLPPESFEFYVGLGNERSYDAVAKRYGVSKRAVAGRASKERWQQRLAALVSGARAGADEAMQRELEEAEAHTRRRTRDLQDAILEVLTPQRMRALVTAILRNAVQTGDVAAARLLLERVLGKPRTEPLSASALDLPEGLKTTADIREAVNTILQGVASGTIAPEDAQRAAAVVDAARKSIETDELEKRIAVIEDEVRKDKAR